MPNEQSILHLGSIKMRAVGQGAMALQLKTFDDLQPVTLISFTLINTTNRVLQRLANYTQQGMMLRGAATTVDDVCRVQDITLFVKQIYTEWPM